MHRIAAIPGGWDADTEGVIYIEQTPAPIIFITAADTDIQTLSAAVKCLPDDFPEIRVANLLQLQQQLTIDTYAEDVLQNAELVIVRLLGGRAYWSYGLEVLRETVAISDLSSIVMPGDDGIDPDLASHSTVALPIVNRVWQYFNEGGVENFCNGLKFAADKCLNTEYLPPAPKTVPRVGLYPTNLPKTKNLKVGILFYRAHYLSGNTKVIDSICQALIQDELHPVPVFISSLRDIDVQEEILELFQDIEILINATGFSLAKLDTEQPNLEIWKKLDVPVLQVILSGGTREQWETQFRGLSPRDVAMNVALPEVDGRIISRAVSFKQVCDRDDRIETEVVTYEPIEDRIHFVAELTKRWVELRQTPPEQQRIGLILANYPNKDARLANGVGLDTPASTVEILKALKQSGYTIGDIPENSDNLIDLLTSGITNDPEGFEIREVLQSLSLKDYQLYFDRLPQSVRNGILNRWGEAKTDFAISGVQLGNIFVGIQPSRGYDRDPSLNYHAPDLEPTHDYLAFYFWLRERFKVQSIVHVGKHGNLEWLPGKSVALSEACYPEVAFGALPHFYPFIVNDPGEGSQAKRRAQAVILDHLTPPMTRAELYGKLQSLEGLVDEYYEAENLNPSRLSSIGERIQNLVKVENLHRDLGVAEDLDETELMTQLDGYLCELKEAQIRDGLHIFGKCPQSEQLRDLVVSIARCPGGERLGLTRSIAEDWGLEFNPLTTPLNQRFEASNQASNGVKDRTFRTVGDVVEALETEAAMWVERVILGEPNPTHLLETAKELDWIREKLLPALSQTHREIENLLRGLQGKYVPSGAAGAPTRGRPEVLPTGRNFYTVDIRAIPTESAWDVGRKAADVLIDRYTQDHGEYPKTLGLSVWGTSTMRTGGDDIAEALALLGVKPVWDGMARRVVDFEILPLSVLQRPRVDVTLRISGFFRDAFPNLIELFDRAVRAVSELDEPSEQNSIAAKVCQETQAWEARGLTAERAKRRASYRVFGSKPGAYGAGLQGLIEAQNWTSAEDLAQAYINWSSYAYEDGEGTSEPEAFQWRLQQMQVVLHNQDNREHDLLDSDDYYQFQGGLAAAVKSARGESPQTYFGDNSRMENPKVRSLREEIARVYRSRVVNPKWIAGVMRHGYKGAFEMAATLDYLFAYDATTNCVEDFMYEGVAQAYVFDDRVQEFIRDKNPWALRDMAERLLEANQRGMWKNANLEMLDDLRSIALEAEAKIERKLVPPQ
ncbi:MAG: cobaltochelatase subunit CobN [Cyanobacteria bacterium SBC]|nr:cobaltochelatase subunit CobN [Cyanobacteria bacterium SBC]